MNRVRLAPKMVMIALGLVLVLLGAFSLSIGTLPISFGQLGQALLGQSDAQTALVVMDIRLPRLLLAVLVGAALAVSGAVMQGLFRNPLADPALVGVSSGAALAAVMVIVLGGSFLQHWVIFSGVFALPLAAFVGGALVTWLIYRISTHNGHTDVSLMLLSGIAINAIAASATGLLTTIASNEALRSLTFWTLGSLANARWQDVLIVLFPTLIAVSVTPFYARALNAFLMGESVSQHLGFQVKKLKIVVISITALAVGASVSVSGMIGFVGLVAPHLVRLLVGPDHRWVLPGSAIMGAILVVVADMFARSLLSPAELPIGILLSAIGGPFFLWLLLQRRTRVGF